MNGKSTKRMAVFDYRALRLMVGLVAFALPVIVWLISSGAITSISGSYHTDGRDVFVGSLFVIAALLWAYNGHTSMQKQVSKVAAVAAVLTALFPTSCETCGSDVKSVIHYAAAVVLFSTIAYFCLGPFREATRGKRGKKGRRANVYLVCGYIIVGSMAIAGLGQVVLSEALRKSLALTFWAEFVALWAFGVAWIVAGKIIPLLVDEEEKLVLTFK